MGRKALTYSDYVRAARDYGLTLLESSLPDTIRTPCNWRCLNCGEHLYKSLRNLREGKHACRCQNGQSLQRVDYYSLTIKLNLFWEDDQNLPPNVKTKTRWRKPDGKIFEATYQQLAYYGKEGY